MPLKVGDTSIGALKVGGTGIAAAYVGDTQVFSSAPAAPVWHQDDTKTATSGFSTNNDITVDRPDNVSEGDLVVIVAYVGSGNISVPSGFSLVRDEQTIYDTRVGLFVKIATDSEPSSYAVGSSDYTLISAVAGRVTGHHPTNYLGNDSGGDSGFQEVSSFDIPSLEAGPSALLIAAWIYSRGNSISLDEPAMEAAASDEPGYSYSYIVGYETVEEGSTGTRGASSGGTGRWAGAMFAIEA